MGEGRACPQGSLAKMQLAEPTFYGHRAVKKSVSNRKMNRSADKPNFMLDLLINQSPLKDNYKSNKSYYVILSIKRMMSDIFLFFQSENLQRKLTSTIVATFKLLFKLSKYDSGCTCPQVAKYIVRSNHQVFYI